MQRCTLNILCSTLNILRDKFKYTLRNRPNYGRVLVEFVIWKYHVIYRTWTLTTTEMAGLSRHQRCFKCVLTTRSIVFNKHGYLGNVQNRLPGARLLGSLLFNSIKIKCLALFSRQLRPQEGPGLGARLSAQCGEKKT